MAANPDHIRRDAEHAARAEIAVFLSKFQRRMYEETKAHISEAIRDGNGLVLDGTKIGRDSATRAIDAHISDQPLDTIDGRTLEASAGLTA